MTTRRVATNLAILALGSFGFSILLLVQTISAEHKSPPVITLVFSFVASAVCSIGAGWAAVMAQRATTRSSPKGQESKLDG